MLVFNKIGMTNNKRSWPSIVDFDKGLTMAVQQNCLELNLPQVNQESSFDYVNLPVNGKSDKDLLNSNFYHIDISNVSLESIENMIPLYVDSDLKYCDNGIYTWLLISNNMGVEKIYFNKVYSVNEIGTKHQNIVNRIPNLKEIHLAGEFLKNKKEIMYNFLSGTYMLDNVPKEGTKEIIKEFESFLTKFLPKRFKKSFTTDELISLKNMSLSYDDLDMFVDLGFKITVFDRKKECLEKSRYKLNLARYKAQIEHQKRLAKRLKKNFDSFPLPIKPKEPSGEPYTKHKMK
jgi:hypothetical protein